MKEGAAVQGMERVRALPHAIARQPGRWAVGAVVTLVLGGATAVGVIGWLGAERVIHPAPASGEPTLARYSLPVQDVRFPSRDGTSLAGWWLPVGRPGAATLVLLDGYGGTRAGLLPQAAYLFAAGYNVLLFDFRARGQSEGRDVTMGAFETGDALGALDFLADRGDVNMHRVGLQGGSMGAAVAIMAGSADPRVAGVVAEAPFEDVSSIIGTEYRKRIGVPSFPFAPVTIAILERRLGVRMADISPIRGLAGLAGRPLFLIEDANDQEVTPNNQQALYEAAAAPKELWRIEGAGHAGGHDVVPAEYERRVLAFWEATFRNR
jgi:fermentation-respiration switch protein FrsA (DUF1100 family)